MPNSAILDQRSAFKVLVVISRPLDQKELPKIADQWALVNGLTTVKAPVHLHILRPPTIDQLRDEILNGYDVIHFDGHGSQGYLAFEKENGLCDFLAADELAKMMRDSYIKLLFLSACESAAGGKQSLAQQLLDGGVPAVLAMNEMVTVEVTVALSRAFYAALGAGKSIENAFRQSMKSGMSGTKAKDIPVLLGSGVGEKLVEPGAKGMLVLDRERLIGVPEFDFVGEYISEDPPRGRMGLLYQLIDALLNGVKLAVLAGQAGIGKSVLAAAAARRISWRYPGGVFWIDATNEYFGLNELLDVFAIPEVFGYEFRSLPLGAKRATVLRYLDNLQTPCLLVVNNAEKIKEQQFWAFIEGIPRPSAAIATTREAIGFGRTVTIPKMEHDEALNLFIIQAGLIPSNRNKNYKQTLNAITDCLEGHPLAIKLVAALMDIYSPKEILKRLNAALPQQINDLFLVSYCVLSDDQKKLLHRIAAFTGSFNISAVEAVSTGQLFEVDAISQGTTTTRIPLFEAYSNPNFLFAPCLDSNVGQLMQWETDFNELIRKSFIDVEKHGLNKRYRLHSLMRQFAESNAGSFMKAYHRRVAYLFLGMAESDERDRALDNERDNILAGVKWAYDAEEWGLVKRFAWAVDSYLATRGYWKDRQRILDQAIEATRCNGDKKGWAETLHKKGNLAYATGDLKEAKRLYKESLDIKEKMGDRNGMAITLHQMGMMANATGDLKEARKMYEESLKIKLNEGDLFGVGRTLHQLGVMAYDHGNLEAARKLYHESLRIKKVLKDESGEAQTLHQIGVICYDTGNIREADRQFRKSLKIKRKLNDMRGLAITLHQMGNVANATGKFVKAWKLYHKSLEIKQDLMDKRGVAITLHQIGNLAYAAGDLVRAQEMYYESLRIRKELSDISGVAKTLHKIGNMAYDTGNISAAKSLYCKSLKIKQGLGEKSGIAKTLHKMGNLAYETGDLANAEILYNKSLSMKEELEDKRGRAITLHQLGNMALDKGDLAAAKNLYDQCLDIEHDLDDQRGIAKTIHQMGSLAYLNDDLDQALNLYTDSLTIERRMGDKRGEAQTLHNCGIIASRKGDQEKANRLYLNSLRIKQLVGDKRGVAITLHQMGNMALDSACLSDAEKFYKESLKIEGMLEDVLGQAITLAQLSRLEIIVKDFESAHKNLDKANNIFSIIKKLGKNLERLEKKGR